MATPEGFFDMKTTAQMSGLSPSVIRMWEMRYRWPAPKRMQNGYRIYSPAQVAELRKVAELIKGGLTISQLVDKTGCLTLPVPADRKPTRPTMERSIQLLTSRPVHASSLAPRQAILEAFAAGRTGDIMATLAEADRAHPRDRMAGYWQPVAIAIADLTALGHPIAGLDKIVATLSTSMRSAREAEALLLQAREDVAGPVEALAGK